MEVDEPVRDLREWECCRWSRCILDGTGNRYQNLLTKDNLRGDNSYRRIGHSPTDNSEYPVGLEQSQTNCSIVADIARAIVSDLCPPALNTSSSVETGVEVTVPHCPVTVWRIVVVSRPGIETNESR